MEKRCIVLVACNIAALGSISLTGKYMQFACRSPCVRDKRFEMQDWKELAGLRVIRRMAEIVNKRWNLGVGFADSSGALIRGPEVTRFATHRPFCELIKSCREGRKRCSQTAIGMIEHHNSGGGGEGAVAYTCHAGLTEIYVPVKSDGEEQGLILAGGMFTERHVRRQREKVLSSCADLDLPAEELQKAVRKITVLSDEAQEYLRDLLELVVRETLVYQEEIAHKERRLDRLTRELAERSSYRNIIGKSPPMRELYRLLDKVAGTDATVLIEGENGTGKELVSRAIHFNSSRKNKPIVVQNCSAFNDNLLDSELFGHARGAFTGAVGTKKGLFEVADGGTFFLDEIGDMSPALQVKLLRILQEGTFIPVGSTQTRKVDVRIIAATHRDLKKMVEQGLFREDLYYRINVITVALPPLRKRREDIPVLAEYFLAKHSQGKRKCQLLSSCMERLMDYHWPGNVRELENEIERLLVLCSDDRQIGEEFVSPRIRYEIYHDGGGASSEAPGLPQAVERLERTMILDHLKQARWNKTKAAITLGIS
ncbi:MAG: sigma 54-interacting transcriptional regulator, partial [Deltaproteobacteria bacterium]|nr:sigma 54-interacting transcriptional regulator [Deltaproteobacteria bacterium]